MRTSSNAFTWIGRVATGLAALILVASLAVKVLNTKDFADEFTGLLGWPPEMRLVIILIEASCIALCLIPKTEILGAILLTAYMGGAVATHLRVHDNFAQPVVIGVLIWAGIFFRDPQLRALLPVRRTTASPAAKS